MRSTTVRVSAGALSLAFFVACVSDTGLSSGSIADAGTSDAATNTDSGSSGGSDTGPGPTDDGGKEAGPTGTTCSNDQVFDKEDPINGGSNATWFSAFPGEQHAYFVTAGKLFHGDLNGNAVSNVSELASKADSVSGAIDVQGKNLVAFRGSSIDVNTFVTWAEPGQLSQKGTQIDKFIHANLLHDGTRMIARYDSANGAGGDNKFYEFLITPDYRNGSVGYQQQGQALNEVALHPVYGFDGLSLIYLSATSGLSFATRTNIALAFDTPQTLKRAANILADAHPHSLSRDKCRLYFTRPGVGAFVASRKPNLP